MKTNGKYKLVLSLILGLQVLLLGIFYFKYKGTTQSSGSNSSASYLPIFFAAFIPLVAAKNKKLTESVEKKKLIFLLALGLLALFGILLFIYKGLV